MRVPSLPAIYFVPPSFKEVVIRENIQVKSIFGVFQGNLSNRTKMNQDKKRVLESSIHAAQDLISFLHRTVSF